MLKATVRGSLAAALACGLLVLLAAARADAAPAWLAPVSISEAGQEAGGPQVAFDSHGDAVAVWDSAAGTGKYGLTTHVVQAAFRPAGGSWQAPVSVGWCNEGSCEPQVGIDTRGDAVALWQAYTGFTFVVESSYKPAGGAWQAPVLLSPAEIPGAAHPKLAVDAQGDAITVWDRGSAIDAVTQAAFMPAGGTWQAPVDISPEGDSAFEPQIAFDGHGDAQVLWYHVEGKYNGNYEYVAQASFMPAGGAWQAPVDISALGLASGLNVTFDEAGNAAAIWDQWTHGFLSTRTVQAAFMPAGGTWQSPVSIVGAEDELDQPKGAGAPGIAVDGHGDTVAVWPWEFGGNIQAAFRPAGGAWQAPLNISAFDENARNPRVAFDSQGNAIAVWALQPSVGAPEVIQSAFMPAGGTWQAPVDISGEDASFPEVAFDGQGDAIAVWDSGNGTNDEIQSAGYVAAGPRLNSLSIPTTGVVGQPVTFSVASLDVWSVLGETSWSFGDGASATGTGVTHVYTAPSTYEVTLQSADTLGNMTSTSGKIAIAPAPPTPTPVTSTPAALIPPPTTPTGSTAPAGPAGKNGEVELVTCNAVTTDAGKARKTVQQCTTKLMSSPITITTAGASIAAVLSRGKVVYATGSATKSRKQTKLLLIPRQRIRKGSYTLTLTHGPERLHEPITID